MKVVGLTEGYSGKEWKRDEKHRVYIMSPSGEVGYFDLSSGEFNSSPRAKISFGICDAEDASIKLETSSGKKVYLGQLEDEIPENQESRTKLQEAIKSFNNLTANAEKTRVEINLGPTVEFKVKGKSHWAKANVTLAVDNGKEPLDIEKVYDATSDMVAAMLDLEMAKFA